MIKYLIGALLLIVVSSVFVWQRVEDRLANSEYYRDPVGLEAAPETPINESFQEPLPLDITAVPAAIELPDPMAPELSERWLDFLRNNGEADLEENLVVLHGEYKKALKAYGNKMISCRSRLPSGDWVGRAQQAIQSGAIAKESDLLRALTFQGMRLAGDCQKSMLKEAAIKEEELIVLLKVNFEMAQKFALDLESEDKLSFEGYAKTLKLLSEKKTGPLSLEGQQKVELVPEMVNTSALAFVSQDTEFSTPFRIEKAQKQWLESL